MLHHCPGAVLEFRIAARGEVEGARRYLEMWEGLLPDHFALPMYRERVADAESRGQSRWWRRKR